jgi:hypothetical protein
MQGQKKNGTAVVGVPISDFVERKFIYACSSSSDNYKSSVNEHLNIKNTRLE